MKAQQVWYIAAPNLGTRKYRLANVDGDHDITSRPFDDLHAALAAATKEAVTVQCRITAIVSAAERELLLVLTPVD